MIIKKNIEQETAWLFGEGGGPIQLKVIQPAGLNSVRHYHKTMHEYFYVLEGSTEIEVDGQIYSLSKDDLLVAEPGEVHKVNGFSPDMKLLLLMPPPVADDKVVCDEP